MDIETSFHGHAYLIEINARIIKVGQSINPRNRLSAATCKARLKLPNEPMITNWWVSKPTIRPTTFENILLTHAEEMGTYSNTILGDYFEGIAWEKLQRTADLINDILQLDDSRCTHDIGLIVSIGGNSDKQS